MEELITKYCKECKQKFQYGDMTKALSGQMSRKYCDDCKLAKSKRSHKKIRLDSVHENTQALIRKDLLLD